MTRRALSTGLAGLLGLSGCIGLEGEFGTETRMEFSETPTPLPTVTTQASVDSASTESEPPETERDTEGRDETRTPPGEPTPSPSPTEAAPEPVLLVDLDGNPVTVNQLDFGEWLEVKPAEDAPITSELLLVRYPEDEYGMFTDMDAVLGGYAAYSQVCTHEHCEVDDREGDMMVCPCHDGTYDPLEGGMVVSGPPPDPLPQLTVVREGNRLAIDLSERTTTMTVAKTPSPTTSPTPTETRTHEPTDSPPETSTETPIEGSTPASTDTPSERQNSTDTPTPDATEGDDE